MKTSRQFVGAVGLVALAAVLAGCAGADHSADADRLRSDLAELPGVAQVKLDYAGPIVLDSAKVAIEVEMTEAAETSDAVAVVVRAYEAFSSTHDQEEGDVTVRLGDDVVHLRSFKPDAEVAAVEEALDRAAEVLPEGVVSTDVNTQDVTNWPHVETTFTVTPMPARPGDGAERVLETLTRLEQEHGDIERAGWRVETRRAPRWSLGATTGFPGSKDRRLFRQLGDSAVPGAGVQVIEDFVAVELPRGTEPQSASAMAEQHLALLGGVKEAFYDVNGRRHYHAMMSAGDCYFSTSAVGRRLLDDVAQQCREVHDDADPGDTDPGDTDEAG